MSSAPHFPFSLTFLTQKPFYQSFRDSKTTSIRRRRCRCCLTRIVRRSPPALPTDPATVEESATARRPPSRTVSRRQIDGLRRRRGPTATNRQRIARSVQFHVAVGLSGEPAQRPSFRDVAADESAARTVLEQPRRMEEGRRRLLPEKRLLEVSTSHRSLIVSDQKFSEL